MKTKGSWESAGGWYNKLVGNKGHYYHERLVIPGVIKLLNVGPEDRVIEFGCGNGVLERKLPRTTQYLGIDVAESLLHEATKMRIAEKHSFKMADVTTKQNFGLFNKGVVVLAMQNFKSPEQAIKNMANSIVKGGNVVIVLNHPCFRIPRQSGWKVDEQNKQQYRWVMKYLSVMEIPITIHPGQSQSSVTWDFHYPLSMYSQWFFQNGFAIELMEEWVSDKQSEGAHAKMENRSRGEIPLFLALRLVKL